MPSSAYSGISGIDTHAHIFRRDLPLASGRRYSPDYDASVEQFLAQLDRCGLSHGVLIQPRFLGTDNRFMLEALRRYPERLRGVAVVSPDIDDAELDELRTISTNAGDVLVDIEKRERERTGLSTLRVNYNRVHGYFIERSTRCRAGRNSSSVWHSEDGMSKCSGGSMIWPTSSGR